MYIDLEVNQFIYTGNSTPNRLTSPILASTEHSKSTAWGPRKPKIFQLNTMSTGNSFNARSAFCLQRLLMTGAMTSRVGEWLPQDHRVHQQWLGRIASHVDSEAKGLHPVLKEFKSLIDNTTRIRMMFEQMFDEVPKKKPYRDTPTGHPQIRDYDHMLQILNHLLTTAPSWHDKSYRVGFVGLPINALLDWPMGTPSGYAAFLDPQVNAMLKKVLNAWGDFLKSPTSAHVLDNSDSS